MARNGSNPPSGTGMVQSGSSPASEAGALDGVASARQWIGASLASLSGLAAWLDQLQSFNGSALAGWAKALELSAQDLGQVTDAQALVALPAKLANHQFEEMSRHLGGAWQELLAAEGRRADEWRRQLTDQAQQMGSMVAGAVGPDGGTAPPPLAALGQLQDQWLALGQQWIDILGGAFPRRAWPSAD